VIDCPQCLKPVDGQTCPFCGYSELPATSLLRPRDPDWWRCSHVDRGQRCANPGVYSPSTHGASADGKSSGPWLCQAHHPYARFRAPDGTYAHRTAEDFNALRAKIGPRRIAEDAEAIAERLAIQNPL